MNLYSEASVKDTSFTEYHKLPVKQCCILLLLNHQDKGVYILH